MDDIFYIIGTAYARKFTMVKLLAKNMMLGLKK